MRASAFLASIAREMILDDEAQLTRVIGLAQGMIDPDKELSSEQMMSVAQSIRYIGSDDHYTLAAGIAELIRDA